MSAQSESPQLSGKVATLWRYPVKSMLGEELTAAEVTTHGLLGDRAYALLDTAEGKIVSAKNPRKWPRLFDFRACIGYFGHPFEKETSLGVLPSDMVDNSINLSKPNSGRFLRPGQIRQAFSSPVRLQVSSFESSFTRSLRHETPL